MLASLACPVAGIKHGLARGHAGACIKIRGGPHPTSAPCRSGRQLCVKLRADNEQPTSSGRESIEEDIWAAPRQQQQRRPSYKAIAGLTVAGAALTAYLTVQKVTGAPVVCLASGGCGSVLNSDYATVFGIPLSLLGLLGYGGTAALALAGAAAGSREAPLPRFGVLAGSTVLATCSACLLFLLATKFQGEACTWCLTSAALSIGSAAAAAQGFDGSELRQAAPKGAALVAATVIGLSTAWSGARPPNSLASFELAYQRPAVETSSSQQGISLAQQLKQSGAKMYGAFWCSHCLEQKEEFGQQAMKDFPYVECYPDGFGKGKDINPQCRDAKVEAFPSWVIGGTKYEGKQTFTQLKQHLAGQ